MKRLSDFFASVADNLTFGLTAKIREGLGYDDVVDKTSSAYQAGGYVGQALNISLMLVNPTALVGGFSKGLSALTTVQMVGAGVAGVEAVEKGDYLGAFTSFVGMAIVGSRAFNPCKYVNEVPWGKMSFGQKVLTSTNYAQRGLHFSGAGMDVVGGIGRIMDGDILGGLLNFAQAGANVKLAMRACFCRGTPLLTPDGSKAIEKIQAGDLILSRAEHNPDAPVEAKVVEEVFVRLGSILHLHVGGQVIRTTPEHPFWVKGKGWLPAGQLAIRDLLNSHDGLWIAVDDLLDTGEVETVYNLRIADYHSYFVGAPDWGFSVWAHNATYRDNGDQIKEFEIRPLQQFKAFPGDGLAPHEILQHAWLKGRSLAGKNRGVGVASAENPSMALSDRVHALVFQEQAQLGLHGPAIRDMSALENIRLNAVAMYRTNQIPNSAIERQVMQAIEHGIAQGVIPKQVIRDR